MPRRQKANRISRRVFIQRLTFFGGGVVLIGAACKRDPKNDSTAPGKPDASAEHLTFSPEEYALVAAACDRVVPRDEDPGALDADVPVYIDRMLQTVEMRKVRLEFLAGAAALDRRSKRMFGKGFAEATPPQQDDLLGIFKDSPHGTGEAHWFELLVVLTMEGLLGDPSYGGNKDRVGWALVGFGTSEPPPNYSGSKHLHAHGGH